MKKMSLINKILILILLGGVAAGISIWLNSPYSPLINHEVDEEAKQEALNYEEVLHNYAKNYDQYVNGYELDHPENYLITFDKDKENYGFSQINNYIEDNRNDGLLVEAKTNPLVDQHNTEIYFMINNDLAFHKYKNFNMNPGGTSEEFFYLLDEANINENTHVQLYNESSALKFKIHKDAYVIVTTIGVYSYTGQCKHEYDIETDFCRETSVTEYWLEEGSLTFIDELFKSLGIDYQIDKELVDQEVKNYLTKYEGYTGA